MVTDGQNPGKEYFFEETATIGRVENNDIVLVEPGISRNHARVANDHGIYLLEDLGSANGTRLNGDKIAAPEVLRDGDYITLAQVTLQFSLLDAARGEITSQASIPEVEIKAADVATSTKTISGLRGRLRTWRGKAILALCVAVIAITVIAVGARLKPGQTTFFDQSDVPLVYSDETEFFSKSYGYGKYDQTHLSQVMVNFEYLGGRATLQYGAWGVDKVGEVAILLNGETVGQVPLTMGRWSYGLKLVLPRDKLRRGKTNTVVFRNTLNPRAKESWEVCYLQILQEAIPPADEREARHQFDLAKKAWEDREIEPGNMYTALVGFRRTRDLLELLPDKPELYQETLDFIDKVDGALTRKFEDGLFSARRAEKFDGDSSKARTLLLNTLSFFRKDDFRYREVQRYLDTLAEAK
jgi:pSer/pThr/pTyr-binding forkhead associated (FHA) protein